MANFKAGNTTTISWYFDESIGGNDIKVSLFDCQMNLKYETYFSDGKIISDEVTIGEITTTGYILTLTSEDTQGWSGNISLYFLLKDSQTIPTINGGETHLVLPFEVTPDTLNIR
jgi:hypothetical protein